MQNVYLGQFREIMISMSNSKNTYLPEVHKTSLLQKMQDFNLTIMGTVYLIIEIGS